MSTESELNEDGIHIRYRWFALPKRQKEKIKPVRSLVISLK